MARSWAELQRLTDDEIRQLHDERVVHTDESVALLRDELRHRQIARHTRAMVWLTVVIAFLTLANVVLVALTLTD